jgi:hypothetical protein
MRVPPAKTKGASPAQGVLRGAERAKALAAVAAEAHARLQGAPDPFSSRTAEQRARDRASREPEILGWGPQRVPPDAP